MESAALHTVLERKVIRKSLRTKESRDNVPQSCHPFYFQLYRVACRQHSKNSHSSLDVFHVGVGRKGRKGKRAGGILSGTERHRGRNFQYKVQITEAPSQTLTTISTSVQVIFQRCAFRPVDSKARHHCSPRRTGGEVNRSKPSRQTSRSQKLKAASQLILTIWTFRCQKRPKFVLKLQV